MRLFFAIELPGDVQAILGGLRPKDENRDYRWVEPSLLHLTLAFLGEQPEEQLEALREVGASAVGGSRSGRLHLGQAGSFGSRRAPRVLWVDLAGDLDALLSLQTRLVEGLAAAEFPIEDRPFRPHVTLARRRETAQGGPPKGWPPTLATGAGAFTMDKLTLFQSRLSPRGPTYVPLAEFPIGG
jgi:2'-5' RNA ligase